MAPISPRHESTCCFARVAEWRARQTPKHMAAMVVQTAQAATTSRQPMANALDDRQSRSSCWSRPLGACPGRRWLRDGEGFSGLGRKGRDVETVDPGGCCPGGCCLCHDRSSFGSCHAMVNKPGLRNRSVTVVTLDAGARLKAGTIAAGERRARVVPAGEINRGNQSRLPPYFGEIPQLVELDIGNRPEHHAVLGPVHDIVALAPCRLRRRRALPLAGQTKRSMTCLSR